MKNIEMQLYFVLNDNVTYLCKWWNKTFIVSLLEGARILIWSRNIFSLVALGASEIKHIKALNILFCNSIFL